MTEARKFYQRLHREKLKIAGLCTKCGKDRDNPKYLVCNTCRTKPYYIYTKEKHNERKLKCFEAYGGCFCSCCKESNPIFLSIDHIENNGANHRNSMYKGKRSGGNIYTYLSARNYPSGYQVLCHNCNHGKHINGGICPHQENKNVKEAIA